MRVSVDAVLPQVRALGGELVIADASPASIPDWASEPDVTWLQVPGAASHELRQAAYAACQAPIIAIIEDHVAPNAGWLAAVLDEHAREPDADVIFGIVDNGSREHLVDWALYGVGYMAWAPPAPHAAGNPGHANLSFKRRVFDEQPPLGDQVLEFRYIAALRAAGRKVVASDRMRVTHFQSAGLRATTELFFHNGRAIAGLRRQQMSSLDWLRTIAPLPIAAYRTVRTLNMARSKPAITATMNRSAGLIVLLHVSHALGESVGYLGGAGDSGTHLH